MDVRKELYNQITWALADATFPLTTPEALLGAFPDGAATTCQAGSIRMTAGGAGTLLKPSDFPFKSPKQVADTILERAGL
jgi:hypothetical protein